MKILIYIFKEFIYFTWGGRLSKQTNNTVLDIQKQKYLEERGKIQRDESLAILEKGKVGNGKWSSRRIHPATMVFLLLYSC